MKEKQPTVLKVTDVRNMDVPELKSVVCCDNPATGECLNVCYLEDGGKRVLSLATDAVPAPMRPSGGCSLWLDVDSGEWGGSAPTCGGSKEEDAPCAEAAAHGSGYGLEGAQAVDVVAEKGSTVACDRQ